MSYFIVFVLILFSISRLCRNEFAITLFTDDSPFGGYGSSVSIITTPTCHVHSTSYTSFNGCHKLLTTNETWLFYSHRG
ncbi:hypothetical protein J3E69DRAFT_194944 [Trichoderma sp. SZMC 28015]